MDTFYRQTSKIISKHAILFTSNLRNLGQLQIHCLQTFIWN